ncbi:MAG TPA: peptidylprolyl isomerase [Thermoanaerobaculia bacterium]|jgi:peptidyl-prolyl cis-trans isomerase C|nr:peptidylprolyl isomerase [Thermoanaerobaculia bacterium]
MKRFTVMAALALLALPVLAQQQDPAKKPVAVINGETITEEQLNRMYDNLGARMKANYQKSGGKGAFLENYIAKRLIIQEALKSGFDKKPEIQAELQAAREAALFDRYVRDVIAQPVITDEEVRKYYDEHPDEFHTPETVKVRHIIIMPNGAGPKPHTKEEAMALIQQINADLRSKTTFPTGTDATGAARIMQAHFAQAAQQYSEDGSAASGGDLGWVERGQLDSTFADAAFTMKKGALSGVIETRFGYHLVFVEDKRPASTESFADAKAGIREFMMSQRAADVVNVVTKLTNELRASSKVSVFPENIDN